LFNVFTKHNRSSSVHLLQHFKRHVKKNFVPDSNAHVSPLEIFSVIHGINTEMRNCLYRNSRCRHNFILQSWRKRQPHTSNHFNLASYWLWAQKCGIYNLVHLIYVGSCYYKSKCLYRHTRFSLPSQIFLSVTNSKMFFVYYLKADEHVGDVTIPTQVIEYNQHFLQAD
jgi:hypothetical protein